MEQMQPQGAPAQEQPKEGGGVSQMLTEAFQNLAKVLSIMSQSGKVPEDKLQGLAEILKALKAWGESMAGGEQGAPQKQAPGTSTPEQGANPNARPAL